MVDARAGQQYYRIGSRLETHRSTFKALFRADSDALLLLPRHERAHRRRRVEGLADDHGGHLLEHSFDDGVVDRPLDQQPRRRGADLARACGGKGVAAMA